MPHAAINVVHLIDSQLQSVSYPYIQADPSRPYLTPICYYLSNYLVESPLFLRSFSLRLELTNKALRTYLLLLLLLVLLVLDSSTRSATQEIESLSLSLSA